MRFLYASLRGYFPVPLLFAMVLSAAGATASDDPQTARCDAMLRSMAAKPYPPTGAWHTIARLMAAGHGAGNGDAARQELRELRDQVRQNASRSSQPSAGAEGEEEGNSPFTHWHAYLLERVWFLFCGNPAPGQGRALDEESAQAICEILWLWAAPLCRLELADPERTWDIWGSENHHLMMWTSLWGATQILAQHPEYRERSFGDASTPAQALPRFEAWFKRYARERATKGLLVECGSPTYAKYSVGCWYNLADFSRDEELRRLFGMLLDVYWADWALDQLDGVRGGSRHRNYPGEPSWSGSATSESAWYHFGVGSPKSKHPGVLCAATSLWRPDPVVSELIQGAGSLGTYVALSRRPGRLREGAQENAGFGNDPGYLFGKGVYQLDPLGGDLLRYTYRTPDFVMGTSLLPAGPPERWSRISSQNRFEGVLFGGHPTARLFVQPPPPKRGSLYHAQWSVQSKGTLILQRLKGSKARGQRVWFDPALPRVERDGWVFVQAPRAFAAVKIVTGGADWQAEPALPAAAPPQRMPWLQLRDEFSPVIFEVMAHSAVPDQAAFEQRLLSAPVRTSQGRLEYASPFSGSRLTLYTDESRLPEVDGNPVALTPPFVFESPFLRAEFGGTRVEIRTARQAVTLDFATAQRVRG